jgi:hypothetical protein
MAASKRFLWSDEDDKNRVNSSQPKKTTGFKWSDEDSNENQQTKGLLGVGQDIKSSIKGIPNTINELIASLVTEVPGVLSQAVNAPSEAFGGEVPRLAKNLAKGTVHLFNAPSGIAKYLGEKGFISPEYGEGLHINEPDFGLGSQQPGDAFAQGIPGMLVPTPFGKIPGISLPRRMGKRSAQGLQYGLLEQQDPLQSAILGGLIPGKKTDPRLAELQKLMAVHEKNLGHENLLKETARDEFKTNNPHSLLHNAAQKEAEYYDSIHALKNIEPEDLTNKLPAPTGENLVPQAKEANQQINANIANLLGPRQNHTSRAADLVVSALSGRLNPETGKREGGLKQELGSEYDSIRDSLQDFYIKAPLPVDQEAIEKTVDSMLQGRASPEDRAGMIAKITSQLQRASGTEQIPASRYFTQFRQARKDADNSRKKAYKIGVSPEEHDRWMARANQQETRANQMSQILESQIGGIPLERLQAVNHRYATEYAPLHNNPLYQDLLHKGRTSKNMLEYLSGTQSGSDILRNFAQQNPEFSRLILGQQYANHPERLMNAPEHAEGYINSVPQLTNMIQQQLASHNNIRNAEQQAIQVRQEHNRVNEAFKESERIQSHRQSLESSIPRLQNEIKRMKQIAPEITDAMRRSGMSKQQIDELTDAIKNTSNKFDKLKKHAGAYLTGLGTRNMAGLIKDLLE